MKVIKSQAGRIVVEHEDGYVFVFQIHDVDDLVMNLEDVSWSPVGAPPDAGELEQQARDVAEAEARGRVGFSGVARIAARARTRVAQSPSPQSECRGVHKGRKPTIDPAMVRELQATGLGATATHGGGLKHRKPSIEAVAVALSSRQVHDRRSKKP